VAAGDHSTSKRKCPKCGAQAKIEFSESDYSFMRRAELRVESITEGFKVRRLGENAASTEIACVRCGELAKFPSARAT
jgi:ribosomal protein S27AE